MKKIVSLLLALCLVCLMASAVAELDLAGTTWYLVSMEQAGIVMNPAAMGLEISMTLNADGTSAMVAYGQDSVGSWSINGEVISITDEDNNTQEFSLNENGELVADMGEGNRMVFSQTAPEAPAEAAPAAVAAESEEEFFGTFKPVSVSVMGVTMPLEMIFGDAIPVFTVEAGKVITTMGEGDEAEVEEEPAVFEEGMLKLYAAEGDEAPVATVQLIEDGTIIMVIEAEGQTITISTEKVEVAVAE